MADNTKASYDDIPERIAKLEAAVERLLAALDQPDLHRRDRPDTTDPVMATFHSPRLGNGAVPYAPIEEV